MKIVPVSGDLLLKVGLVGLALGGIAWLAYKKRNLVNPLSPDNLAYTGVNAIGASIFTDPEAPGKNADGSWTLGGAIYDWLHPAQAAAVKEITQPVGAPPPDDLVNYNYF